MKAQSNNAIFFLFLSFLLMPSAHSALFKCSNDQGEIEFRDMPCQINTNETELASDYDSRGILKKWFRKPPQSNESVKCIKKVCSCTDINKRYGTFIEQDVINSVDNLLEGWNQLRALRKVVSRNNKGQTKNISCNIRVNQKIFNISYTLLHKKIDIENKALKKSEEKLNNCLLRNEASLNKQVERYRSNYKSVLSDSVMQQHLVSMENQIKLANENAGCRQFANSDLNTKKSLFNYKSDYINKALASIERLK